ncbi:MAG: aa3-type cytochrome c oxidase subunit IV [Pseudomonadota bacterium]
MAEHESDHEHGEMDITDQEKTFDGFIRWSINVALISIGIVVFLAIFAT